MPKLASSAIFPSPNLINIPFKKYNETLSGDLLRNSSSYVLGSFSAPQRTLRLDSGPLSTEANKLTLLRTGTYVRDALGVVERGIVYD